MLNTTQLNEALLNDVVGDNEAVTSETVTCLCEESWAPNELAGASLPLVHTYAADSLQNNTRATPSVFMRAQLLDSQRVEETLRYSFPAIGRDSVSLLVDTTVRRLAACALAEVLAVASPSSVSVVTLACSIESFTPIETLRYLVRAVAPDSLIVTAETTAKALARALAQELCGLNAAPKLQLDAKLKQSDTFASADTLRYATQALALEGFSLTDLTEQQVRNLLLAAELLSLASPTTVGVETTGCGADALALVEALRFVARAILADAMSLTDEARAAALWRGLLSDMLGLRASFPLSIQTLGALVDSLAAQDVLRYIAQALVADGLSLEALTDTQAANVLRAVEWLALATTDGVVVDLQARASETLELNAALGFLARGLLQDLAGLADASAAPVTVASRLQDLAGLRAQPAIQMTLLGALADRVATADALHFAAQALIADGLSLETLTQEQTAQLVLMAEALGIGATPTVRTDLLGQLVERLVAHDALTYAFGLSATDTTTLADALKTAIANFLRAPDTLALIDTLRSALVVVGCGADFLVGVDQINTKLSVALHAPETLAFIGLLPLVEGDFQAWVVNTDTLGATSYANFPFNSLYTHQGTTWGVTETGLYELTGDDDDGEPIAALLRTGMLDFGSTCTKSIPRCYLYLHSDGRTVLNTISENDGVRVKRWYEIQALDGGALRVRPIWLGRGLRCAAIAFELTNVDGSSLDLSGFEVIPVVLRRT